MLPVTNNTERVKVEEVGQQGHHLSVILGQCNDREDGVFVDWCTVCTS